MNICDVARQVKSKANKNYDKRVGGGQGGQKGVGVKQMRWGRDSA